ncbi:MAG: hypothetical protein QNJ42_12720 [Crocosphaera sp.]|nr:hypothetical protein [Crocosphaera sp.]
MSLLEKSSFGALTHQEVEQEAFRTLQKSTYKQSQVRLLRLSLIQRMATWFVIAFFSLGVFNLTFYPQNSRKNFFPGNSYQDFSATLVKTRIISFILFCIGVVQGSKFIWLQQEFKKPLEDSKKRYEDLEKEIYAKTTGNFPNISTNSETQKEMTQTNERNINCILEKNERLEESNQELNSYLNGVGKIGTLDKSAKLTLAGLGTGICLISLILKSSNNSLTIVSAGVGLAGWTSYLGQELDEKRRYRLLYQSDNKRIKMLGHNSTVAPIIVRAIDENLTTESMLLRGDSTASIQLEAGSESVSSHFEQTKTNNGQSQQANPSPQAGNNEIPKQLPEEENNTTDPQ